MRLAAVVAIAALGFVGASAAAWSVGTSGNGSAKAGTLVGSTPSLSKSGIGVITVVVSWTATTGATGYTISRTGGIGTLGGTCTGVVAGTTCSDTPLIALQTYTYRVTPVAGTWTGTAGPPASITT